MSGQGNIVLETLCAEFHFSGLQSVRKAFDFREREDTLAFLH